MPATASFSAKTALDFPRPLDPCLYCAHPAADTLQGVAARRGRRFGCGKDVSLHRKGPRKMVSLRRHGGSGGASDRPFASRPERRAGRACAAHKGDGTGGCVGIVRRKESSPGSSLPVRFAKACGRMQKRRCSLPETGENHPRSRPFTERSKSRAETAERGAGRCHTKYFRCGSFQRPVRMLFETPRAKSAAWMNLLPARRDCPACDQA